MHLKDKVTLNNIIIISLYIIFIGPLIYHQLYIISQIFKYVHTMVIFVILSLQIFNEHKSCYLDFTNLF